MTKEEIAKRLKTTRLNKGLSIYRVAKDTGLRALQVGLMEKGEAAYTIDSLIAYAEYLGLWVDVRESNDYI